MGDFRRVAKVVFKGPAPNPALCLFRDPEGISISRISIAQRFYEQLASPFSYEILTKLLQQVEAIKR